MNPFDDMTTILLCFSYCALSEGIGKIETITSLQDLVLICLFPLTGQKTACLRHHSEVIRDTISHRTWLIYLNKGQLLVVILQWWVLTTSVLCGSEVLPPQMQNSPPCICSGAANPASAHHPLVLQMDDSLSQ